MSSLNHSVFQDIDGNTSFIPFSSNFIDKSFIDIYWNDIYNKPSFSNICFTSSYYDVSNIPILKTVATTGNYNDIDINLIPWMYSNNQQSIYNISCNIGIGLSNPQYKLDILGDLNISGSLNQNGSLFNSEQWISSNSNIFFNSGKIGIGKSNDINEILDINGNIKIEGYIYPSSNNYYDLGTSNYRWRDLYLSCNSIYLDNIIISKKDNNIDIKNSNEYSGLNINQLNIYSNNNKFSLSFNSNNNSIIFNQNNLNYYPVYLSNNYNSSNLIFSNSLNTDLINIGSSNKFIVNNIYNNDIIFSCNVFTSNIIVSNLYLYGNLNTNIYQNKQFQINNYANSSAFIINHLNNQYNIVEFYNNLKQPIFIISSNNFIGINKNNPNYNLDINGSLNTNDFFLNNQNISNIIDNKINQNSNLFIDYNNLINKSLLSSIATSGDYNDLTNEPFINSNNNLYTSNINYIGIGITNPNYKLDVNGSINTNVDIYIKDVSLSNIIIQNSNLLINYNNLINKPLLSTVAISGDYNDVLNKYSSGSSNISINNVNNNDTWIINGNNIYNSNSGFVGIGNSNPLYTLDINSNINIDGNLFINNNSILSTFLNTNIITNNASLNYNSNYGYFMFLSSGSITFPINTYCDILIVGAGGNGGNIDLSNNIFAGGGAAGEVIFYPNYLFNNGTYNISIGFNNIDPLKRISKIINAKTYANEITANGGGDGGGILNYINTTTSNYIIYNTINYICNYEIAQILNSGTYNFLFQKGNIIINNSYTNSNIIDRSYPLLKDSNLNTINPIAWYKFDNSNNIGLDTMNTYNLYNSNNCILNSVSLYGGRGQNVVYFNGTNYLNTSNFINLNAQSFSICFWTYLTSISGTYPQIIFTNNKTTSVAQDTILNIGFKTTSIFTFDFYSDAANYTKSPNNWLSNWTFWCCTFNINTKIQIIYENGINVYQRTAINGLNMNTAEIFSIGRGTYNLNYFTGIIDDFRIYTNIVLSSSQIYDLYIGKLILYNIPSSGGSGGGAVGGLLTLSNNQNYASKGTSFNSNYSYLNDGFNGTSNKGGDGGSALPTGSYIETITGSNLILGIGGSGATSNFIPNVYETSYGCGGDANGGFGTQGVVIIKVPLNTLNTYYNGSIDYNNIINRPYIIDLIYSRNFIDIGYFNQINFPLGFVSWSNEWLLYVGNSPTNINNSFIFYHNNSNLGINSKWWFNGTIASTNNEISDFRVKKEIIDLLNPLDKLELLKPKEYYLCDEKDYLKKYGIIAQDVKDVLPEFVYTDEDYVANIYTKAIYINNSFSYQLITEKDISNLINIGDEIKILLDNLNIENQEIIIEDIPYHNRYKKRFATVKSIINNNTIEITNELELSEKEKTEVFIYGKKVNDFLKLDYSSLYTLNIASSQELYKKINERELLLKNLMNRIIILENKNSL